MDMSPPSFKGKTNEDPHDFLRALEHIFDVIMCTNAERVIFTAFKLEGYAVLWWESFDRHGDISWAD